MSRHCIAVIEAAPSSAAARNEHRIKGLPSSLVGIEPLIKILAQQPSALRIAITQDILLRLGVLSKRRIHAAVLQIRHEVAKGGKAQPRNRRGRAGIDCFVELALLESLRQMNRAG